MADHSQRELRYTPVRAEALTVGEPVPATIYDPYERVLLPAGQALRSEEHRKLLLEIGRVRAEGGAEVAPGQATPADLRASQRLVGGIDPFKRIRRCVGALSRIYATIEAGRYAFLPRLYRALALLGDLIDRDADAALGAAYLERKHPTSIIHPVRCAVITDLLARGAEWPGRDRHAAVGAALTANLGMFELQRQLDDQLTPLSETQRYELHRHPERTAERLRQAGLDDPAWLQAVEQHHERLDGSGYPRGLTADSIGDPACLVMLSDVYTALISPRAYRDAREVHRASRELYELAGRVYPKAYTQLLIKSLGLFPPGTAVRLSNGERALVARRGPTTTRPTVYVYANKRGNLETPFSRALSEEDLDVEAVLKNPPRPAPFSLYAAWGYTPPKAQPPAKPA